MKSTATIPLVTSHVIRSLIARQETEEAEEEEAHVCSHGVVLMRVETQHNVVPFVHCSPSSHPPCINSLTERPHRLLICSLPRLLSFALSSCSYAPRTVSLSPPPTQLFPHCTSFHLSPIRRPRSVRLLWQIQIILQSPGGRGGRRRVLIHPRTQTHERTAGSGRGGGESEGSGVEQ